MQTQTTIAPAAAAANPIFHRIWPLAAIAFGLALTVAWIFLLGYGLVTLIEIVI